MAKIKIHVWHNLNGEIVAVGRPTERIKAIPLAGIDQSVLETEFDEDQLATLVQTHFVDMTKKALVKRP
jgi:hypothetical protein